MATRIKRRVPPHSELASVCPQLPWHSLGLACLLSYLRALRLPADAKSLTVSNHGQTAATCQAVSEGTEKRGDRSPAPLLESK